VPLGEVLNPDGYYGSWGSGNIAVNQSTQVPMVCVLLPLEVREKQKKIPHHCSAGLGKCAVGNLSLRDKYQCSLLILIECARLEPAIFTANTSIPRTSGSHSGFLSLSANSVSFGAFGTSFLSVLTSDSSWVHLTLCSWSFSWTSLPHSTPLLSDT
jgi:hypothetical protein